MGAERDADADGVVLDDLLRDVGADRTGALWRLTGAARQLDANVVRLAPGASIAEHVEPDLDVLVAGIAGRGTLRCEGTPYDLLPGAMRFLARGVKRGVYAGQDGVVYMTVHRRRPGLAPRPASFSAVFEDEGEGGEAPCLLNQVCADCGAVVEVRAAAYCPRCGQRLP